jgi:hypothetical protein
MEPAMKFLRLSPGTKSVLFGVHQFLIHPFVVAVGWYRAFGFARVRIGERYDYFHLPALTPGGGLNRVGVRRAVFASLLDPRLWLAFFVHDIGLFGKPDMDGPIGETHPEVGANLMRRLFGDAWGDLVLLHSRYYAKRLNRPVSPLCLADKWAIIVEPSWLYLPRAWATRELHEYMAMGRKRAVDDPIGLTANERDDFLSDSAWRWHGAVKSYMRRWLSEHADGRPDTWTRVRHAESHPVNARPAQGYSCYRGHESQECIGCVSAEACRERGTQRFINEGAALKDALAGRSLS